MNGWQRLWVVTAGFWLLAVLVVGWSTWPTVADLSEAEILARLGDVPDAEIRARLSPAENVALTPFSLLAGKLGGSSLNPYDQPDLTSVPVPDPAWLWTEVVPKNSTNQPSALLSVREFAHLVKVRYPKHTTMSDDVLTANVLGKYPEYRARVDPRAIAAASQRFEDEVGVQKRLPTIARTVAIRPLVRAKRARMVGILVAAWALPLGLLCALGWSVGWVRRGFEPVTPYL